MVRKPPVVSLPGSTKFELRETQASDEGFTVKLLHTGVEQLWYSAMGSIEEALKTAGAEDDLQTILQVLEDKSVGFKRHEAAAGPFANMDTAMLTGLNIRMHSAIKRAQQQHQGRPLSAKFCNINTLYM